GWIRRSRTVCGWRRRSTPRSCRPRMRSKARGRLRRSASRYSGGGEVVMNDQFWWVERQLSDTQQVIRRTVISLSESGARWAARGAFAAAAWSTPCFSAHVAVSVAPSDTDNTVRRLMDLGFVVDMLA